MNTVRVRLALLIYEEDRVLMIRHKKDSREYWLVPGGGLEFGETVDFCIKREMKEECGIDVCVEKFVFSCETIGNNRHILHLFFRGKRTGGNLRLGNEENLAGLEFIPLDRLKQITVYPEVTDMITSFNSGNDPQVLHIFGNIWEE